jgi:hypothetical protein
VGIAPGTLGEGTGGITVTGGTGAADGPDCDTMIAVTPATAAACTT